MTFRDLPIGASFTFDNGVSTFRNVCKKISVRRYTWQLGTIEAKSTVGTVNVQVKVAA